MPPPYGIHSGYRARTAVPHFDDTGLTDEYQREVYAFARKVLDDWGLRGVCDVGCGSGYKLVQFFPDQQTLGLDVPSTVSFLRARYPDRAWDTVSFKSDPEAGATCTGSSELVICADVIEHLLDPDDLLNFLCQSKAEQLIISTPKRIRNVNGPPKNRYHVREWSEEEFAKYVGEFLAIDERRILGPTQVLRCFTK